MTRLMETSQKRTPHTCAEPGNIGRGEHVNSAEAGTVNPTLITYGAVDGLFHYFNVNVFGGQLPHCLLTLQRSRKACGYFDYRRFASRDRSHVPDELALNPR